MCSVISSTWSSTAVPRVETDKFCVWEVPQVCVATLRREEDVALSPEDESERLALAERLLPGLVQGGVRPVVVEEVELHAMCIPTSEEKEIEPIPVRSRWPVV
jgi:hypothetical protein